MVEDTNLFGTQPESEVGDLLALLQVLRFVEGLNTSDFFRAHIISVDIVMGVLDLFAQTVKQSNGITMHKFAIGL